MRLFSSALFLGAAMLVAPSVNAQIYINESFATGFGSFSSGTWQSNLIDGTVYIAAPAGSGTLSSSPFTIVGNGPSSLQFTWGFADVTPRTMGLVVNLTNLTTASTTSVFSFTNAGSAFGGGTPTIVPLTLLNGNQYSLSFVASNVAQTTLPTDQIILEDVFVRQVPGPLPVLGALAAFGWSRKLRNKIKVADAGAVPA